MIVRFRILLVLSLLGSFLIAQQITYTSVPNIKDTFDYSEHTSIFHNQTYLQRSRLPEHIFFSRLDNFGNPIKNYIFTPKLGYIRFAFHSIQIGSKLFQFGAEEDTIDRRGSVLILNSDLTVYRDSVFFDYPNMEFNVGRYDHKRNRVLTTFSYSIHKDSFLVRRWGILELDTLGNVLRKKEIAPLVRFEYADNLLVTSDGGYLVAGKMNGRTTYIDPFFVKLDTNFNVVWRTDLISTGEKFFTQSFSENLVELPNNKGYCYLGSFHRGIDTITKKCWYFDYFTSMHFFNNSGQITKNYYHNLSNQFCEGSKPKGVFLKNDSTLLIFTQRDTTNRINRREDSSSSLVIHYNFNQHKVAKEALGGQLLNGKTSWVLQGYSGVCFRKHVVKDIDGGFITSGWADIQDNNGTAAYLMKTDSCGYTQDHKCKLAYRIGKQVDKSLNLIIDDSLSVLCQPIWTIEGKKYTNLDIMHTFSNWGWHRVKLWGFAGSTTDSAEFDVYIDSTKSGIVPIVMNTIAVYPNPASTYLYIDRIDTRDLYFQITDLAGRVFKSDKYIDKIEISMLDSGVYILELINNEKRRFILRFVVRR